MKRVTNDLLYGQRIVLLDRSCGTIRQRDLVTNRYSRTTRVIQHSAVTPRLYPAVILIAYVHSVNTYTRHPHIGSCRSTNQTVIRITSDHYVGRRSKRYFKTVKQRKGSGIA